MYRVEEKKGTSPLTINMIIKCNKLSQLSTGGMRVSKWMSSWHALKNSILSHRLENGYPY